MTEERVTVPAVPPKMASLLVPELGQTTSAEPSHQFGVVLESQVPVPPWAPEVTVSEPSQDKDKAEADGAPKWVKVTKLEVEYAQNSADAVWVDSERML